MNWTELLKAEIEEVYAATDGLMKQADGDLSWKPSDENNWMTMGQVLMHLTNACGFCCKGFATGDWGIPEGVEMSESDMLPPAEKMPSVETVEQARQMLAADKAVAMQTIDDVGENDLENKPAPAPWDPRPVPLGRRMLGMISHLSQHKDQLFYYLKLQGKPVNTHDLYGMTA